MSRLNIKAGNHAPAFSIWLIVFLTVYVPHTWIWYPPCGSMR